MTEVAKAARRQPRMLKEIGQIRQMAEVGELKGFRFYL
jgi:hypothetical protein